jgi:sterol desaturase/sphingolipid hydroxylase (fatty acid hydroxylase superfamily)
MFYRSMQTPFLSLLVVAFALIAAEMWWSQRRRQQAYDWREMLANLAIFAGLQFSQRALRGYQQGWIHLISLIALPRLPENGWTFFAAFWLTDFVYYWQHRVMHEVKFFWAFHVVHHSGMRYNLTTSYRLNWLGGLIGVFFYLPLIWLGFAPRQIFGSLALNLFFQFFLHTEAIGRLPWLEGWLNTPSAHRVHHAMNERYLDKNYGGVLLVWDRLFGTYEPETEAPRYGITTGFVSYNPLTLVFHGFADLARGRMQHRG